MSGEHLVDRLRAFREHGVHVLGSFIFGLRSPSRKPEGSPTCWGALPPALARLGWDATVALPKYRGVSASTLVETFPVSVGGYTRDVGFFEAPLPDGARALLVDCPDLYDRDALYALPQHRLPR